MKNRFIFFPREVRVDAINGGFYIRKHLSDHFEPAFKLLPGVYIVSDDTNDMKPKNKK